MNGDSTQSKVNFREDSEFDGRRDVAWHSGYGEIRLTDCESVRRIPSND